MIAFLFALNTARSRKVAHSHKNAVENDVPIHPNYLPGSGEPEVIAGPKIGDIQG